MAAWAITDTTASDVVIENCAATYSGTGATFGGGVYLADSTAVWRRVVLRRNTGGRGGGLYIRCESSRVFRLVQRWPGGHRAHCLFGSALHQGRTPARLLMPPLQPTQASMRGRGSRAQRTRAPRSVLATSPATWLPAAAHCTPSRCPGAPSSIRSWQTTRRPTSQEAPCQSWKPRWSGWMAECFLATKLRNEVAPRLSPVLGSCC